MVITTRNIPLKSFLRIDQLRFLSIQLGHRPCSAAADSLLIPVYESSVYAGKSRGNGRGASLVLRI